MSQHSGLGLHTPTTATPGERRIVQYAGPPPSVQWCVWRCMKCRTRFQTPLLVHVEVSLAVRFMQATRCPACGAGPKQLSVTEGRTLAEDRSDRQTEGFPGLRDDAKPSERLEWWKEHGETGLSSMTMVRAIRRRSLHAGKIAHPLDCDDLRRCLLLLDLVPEMNRYVPDMAEVSPEWAKLAPRWAELAASYLAERPDFDGPAPKTRALLESILQDVPA